MSYYGMKGVSGFGAFGDATDWNTPKNLRACQAKGISDPVALVDCMKSVSSVDSSFQQIQQQQQQYALLAAGKGILAEFIKAKRANAFRSIFDLGLPLVFQADRSDPLFSLYKVSHKDALPLGKKSIIWISKTAESKLPYYIEGRLFGSFSGFGLNFSLLSSGSPSQGFKYTPTPRGEVPAVKLDLFSSSMNTMPAYQKTTPVGGFPVAFITSKDDKSSALYKETHDDVIVTKTKILWIVRDVQQVPYVSKGKVGKRLLPAITKIPDRLYPQTTSAETTPSGASDLPPDTTIMSSGCPSGSIMTTQGCYDPSESEVIKVSPPPPELVDKNPPGAEPSSDIVPRSASLSSWFEERSTVEKVAMAAAGAGILFLGFRAISKK
jgi:hypothetical protein